MSALRADSFPLRPAARAALNRLRILGVVVLALALDLLARVAAGLLAGPTAGLLLPPVLGVPLLAASFPAARAAVDGGDPDWRAVPSTLRNRAPALVAFAVAGHLVALVGGAGLVLVCDTAIRLPLYAFAGGYRPDLLSAYLPLVAVAPTALVAWALLPPAVAPVLDGDGLRAGFRAVVADAAGSPRSTAALLGLHLVAVAVTGGAAVTGFAYVGGARASVAPLVAVCGGLGLLAGTTTAQFVYAAHAAASVARSPPAPLSSPAGFALSRRRPRSIPLARVAVVALLCSSLLVGASAVRLTETRPMDTAPDPLPDDPTAAYAVALNNTERTNHAFTVQSDYVGENGSMALRIAVDRRDRRILFRSVHHYPDTAPRRTTAYWNSGVDAYATDRNRSLTGDMSAEFRGDSEPGYRIVMDDYALGAGNSFSLPAPNTGEWRVADRSEGRVTLLLTDESAAYEALYGYPPSQTDSLAVEDAEVRMTVNSDRGVVTGGGGSVHAVRTDESGAVTSEWTTEFEYDVTVGDSVERPAGLGSPSLSEWLWRLFAY